MSLHWSEAANTFLSSLRKLIHHNEDHTVHINKKQVSERRATSWEKLGALSNALTGSCPVELVMSQRLT